MAQIGYHGTVKDFIDLADRNHLAATISANLESSAADGQSEFESWRCGLQKLANDLRLSAQKKSWILDLYIMCELVFEDKRIRADAVILGSGRKSLLGCKSKNVVACVFELKQWSDDSVDVADDIEYVVANTHLSSRGPTKHPLIQARRYADAIGASAFGAEKVLSIAYLPNMSANHGAIDPPRFPINETREHIVSGAESDKILYEILTANLSAPGPDVVSFFISNEIPISRDADKTTSDDLLLPVDGRGDDIEYRESEEIARQALESSETLKLVKTDSGLTGVGFFGSAEEFISSCDRNQIAEMIRENLGLEMKQTTSEFRSWREGLYRLSVVLRKANILADVACEIPTQAGMVDAIICGRHPETDQSIILVIELKQWSQNGISQVEPEDWMFQNGRISAITGPGGYTTTQHPLWQAERYLRGLRNYKGYFNEHDDVELNSFAFLPNMFGESYLGDERYNRPGLSTDQIYQGDRQDDLVEYLKENFGAKPRDRETNHSSILLDVLTSPPMLTKYIVEQMEDLLEKAKNGQLQASHLVPSAEQQRAVDSILDSMFNETGKSVHILQGGPGTGKTIVGLLALLGSSTVGSLGSFMIAGNKPTPRVMSERIADSTTDYISDIATTVMTDGQMSSRFRDSTFGVNLLVVDEAQSLLKGQGGPPDTAEMIRRSNHVLFMMDDRQNLNYKAPAKASALVNEAHVREAVRKVEDELTITIPVHSHRLDIQQRAGQMTNLLPFLESILGYSAMPPPALDGFDLIVHDTASDLQSAIVNLNNADDIEAGLCASYCWFFESGAKGADGTEIDISLDGGSVELQWNHRGGKDKPPWMLTDDRNQRAAYAPEVQGQELHHVGVILGPDLCVDNGELVFNPQHHDYQSPIFGGSGGSENSKQNKINSDRDRVVALIRNQYWVLLTRGMQSLHVYSEDQDVRDFFSTYA